MLVCLSSTVRFMVRKDGSDNSIRMRPIRAHQYQSISSPITATSSSHQGIAKRVRMSAVNNPRGVDELNRGTETKGSSPDHLPVLYARVVTGSKRNLIRLRVWLACRVYRSFPSVGVCRFGPRSVLKFTPVIRTAEAANIEYIAGNTIYPFRGYRMSSSSINKRTSLWTISTDPSSLRRPYPRNSERAFSRS
ncbi:hypothetical protein BGY98DRAFT_1154363 [Russula aff. rugulosa BPL654]|nr:hypothetical protein BGY98DRAFT_1154363 [Russula aff. rugulosa BPL654]